MYKNTEYKVRFEVSGLKFGNFVKYDLSVYMVKASTFLGVVEEMWEKVEEFGVFYPNVKILRFEKTETNWRNAARYLKGPENSWLSQMADVVDVDKSNINEDKMAGIEWCVRTMTNDWGKLEK